MIDKRAHDDVHRTVDGWTACGYPIAPWMSTVGPTEAATCPGCQAAGDADEHLYRDTLRAVMASLKRQQAQKDHDDKLRQWHDELWAGDRANIAAALHCTPDENLAEVAEELVGCLRQLVLGRFAGDGAAIFIGFTDPSDDNGIIRCDFCKAEHKAVLSRGPTHDPACVIERARRALLWRTP